MSDKPRYYFVRLLHDDTIIGYPLPKGAEPEFEGPLFRLAGKPFELSKVAAHGWHLRDVGLHGDV